MFYDASGLNNIILTALQEDHYIWFDTVKSSLNCVEIKLIVLTKLKLPSVAKPVARNARVDTLHQHCSHMFNSTQYMAAK